MFLEDKLNNVLERHKEIKEKFGVDAGSDDDLLNAMIDHIAERLTTNMSTDNALQLVRQTDNVWRSFANKNNLNPDFFRNGYIIRRCAKMPGANGYFKITKEEIKKYGQN